MSSVNIIYVSLNYVRKAFIGLSNMTFDCVVKLDIDVQYLK